MAGLKLEELYVEIKTKSDQFEKDLTDIKSKLGGIGSSVDSVSEKTSRWGNTATGINQAFGTVRDTFNQLKETLGGAAKASADLEVLRSSFKGTADDISLFKTATANTVSEGNLIKLSNMADALGMSMQDQAIFFALAEDAADAYGGSTEENFQKVIAASEGSDKAVKALGIQKQVYKDILEGLVSATGKEITAMDAEEQKMIRLEALRKASGITLDDVRKKQMDNADAMESLSVAAEEAQIKLGNLLVKALQPLLNAMKDNSGFRTFVGTLLTIGSLTGSLLPIILQLKELQKLTALLNASKIAEVAVATTELGTAAAVSTPAVGGFFATLKAGLISIGAPLAILSAVVAAVYLLTQNINDNAKAIAQHRSEVDRAYPNWDKSGFGAKNQADVNESKMPKSAEGMANLGGYIKSQEDASIFGKTSTIKKHADLVSEVQARIDTIKENQKKMEVGSKELANSWVLIEKLQSQIDKPIDKTSWFGDLEKNKKDLTEITELLKKKNITDGERNVLLEKQSLISAEIYKYEHPNTSVNSLGIKDKSEKTLGASKLDDPDKYKNPMEKTQSDIKDEIDRNTSASENFASTISSGLMQGITAGENLGQVFGNMALQLVEMTAQALIFKGIMALLNLGTGGAAGGAGSFLSLLFGHDGGTFQNGQKIAGYAGGGNFMVPQGFPNDSYPLLVESGERVSVTPAGAVGQQEKLLGELIGSVRAMNKNFMMKNMSVNIDANIDGLTFVRKTTKPAENKLRKNGYNLENL